VAVSTGGIASGITGAMGAAGSNVLVQAAVSSVVNQLSTEILTAVITGESLNIDLGSLVTNAVKSAVFAGVTDAIDTEMFSDAVNDEGVFNPDKLNYTQKAVRNISHASVSTLVYGGDFKQNVINAVGESVAAPAFNYIGHTLTGTDGLKLDKNALSTQALITTSHALVGGTIAELTGGEFSSGAVATAVGHVVGEFIKDRALENLDINNLPFDPNNPNSIQQYVNELENETIVIASAVGGATVLLTQENVSPEELARATSLSASVVENNGFGLITGTILLFVALSEYAQTPETQDDIAEGMPLTDAHPLTASADAIYTLVENGEYDETAVLAMIAKKIPGVSPDKAKEMLDSFKGKNSAKNVASYEKLKKDLKLRERSSNFNNDGTLTQETLSQGKPIKNIDLSKSNNIPLKKNLTSDGSKIEDWNKMSVKIGKEDVHYYQNSKTGKVSYDNDYKTKVSNSYYERPDLNGEHGKEVVRAQHNQNVKSIDKIETEIKETLRRGERWKPKE